MAVQMTSSNLNVALRDFPVVTLNDTLPAAPSGSTNITWQFDVFGNISAYSASSGGGSAGTAGQIQMAGATAGSFAASSLTDNGTSITTDEELTISNTAGATLNINGATNWSITSDASGNLNFVDTAFSATFMTLGEGVVNMEAPLALQEGFEVTISTTATAGAASALPVTPAGYWELGLNGTNVKLPFYSV
jgi:hypothetical protein